VQDRFQNPLLNLATCILQKFAPTNRVQDYPLDNDYVDPGTVAIRFLNATGVRLVQSLESTPAVLREVIDQLLYMLIDGKSGFKRVG